VRFKRQICVTGPQCVKIGNREIKEVEVEELIIAYVKRAMCNLKNNKVAGIDGITSGLKYRENKLLNRIYELLRIPEGWKETIIVPIHKKRR
jgi:hypothetical protein